MMGLKGSDVWILLRTGANLSYHSPSHPGTAVFVWGRFRTCSIRERDSFTDEEMEEMKVAFALQCLGGRLGLRRNPSDDRSAEGFRRQLPAPLVKGWRSCHAT